MKTAKASNGFIFSAVDDESEMCQAPPGAMAARFAALMVEPVDDAVCAPRSTDAPLPGPSQPRRVEMPQALALRVASGPLAGMLLRVFWHDERLEMCFVTADSALARRLHEQSAELGATLSQALGVTVRVGVERDGTA